MTFERLDIIEPILKALEKAGYKKPTSIQEEAIPPLLAGKDLLGCAQTGTGKTAAFAIPILQSLYREKHLAKGPAKLRTLVLTPTRELASQIGSSFATYGANTGLRHTVIFGGVSQVPQVQQLKNGVDILVATPGRLLDLMNQKLISLENVGYFVLDEADRMLDMGFLRDVERVIEALPTKRQTMLFSATMPHEIEQLTKRILHDPVKVAVAPVSSTVEAIEQSVYFVNKANKTKLLVHLLKNPDIFSVLVFTRTKHGANKLTEALRVAGETCEVIHANKAQSARQLALAKFKSNKSRILVATDIVSRGIDILELSHVVNFDLPESPEDYVHRIGRTGRAGLNGTALSFCDPLERKYLVNIERLIGKKIPVVDDHPYPVVMTADAPIPAEKPPVHAKSPQPQPRGRQPRACGPVSKKKREPGAPNGQIQIE